MSLTSSAPYVLAWFGLLPSLGQAVGQDLPQVQLKNTIDEQLSVWIQTEAKKWVQPPLYMTRRGSAVINLGTPGKYYIVLRDNVNRDTHIGWIDFHKIARVPKAELLIDQLVVTEQFTYMVNETVTYTEKRTVVEYQPVAKEEEYIYYVRLPNGTLEKRVGVRTVTTYVPVTKEIAVNVTKLVPVQKMGTRNVVKLGLKIQIGDKVQSLEEFFKE